MSVPKQTTGTQITTHRVDFLTMEIEEVAEAVEEEAMVVTAEVAVEDEVGDEVAETTMVAHRMHSSWRIHSKFKGFRSFKSPVETTMVEEVADAMVDVAVAVEEVVDAATLEDKRMLKVEPCPTWVVVVAAALMGVIVSLVKIVVVFLVLQSMMTMGMTKMVGISIKRDMGFPIISFTLFSSLHDHFNLCPSLSKPLFYDFSVNHQ